MHDALGQHTGFEFVRPGFDIENGNFDAMRYEILHHLSADSLRPAGHDSQLKSPPPYTLVIFPDPSIIRPLIKACVQCPKKASCQEPSHGGKEMCILLIWGKDHSHEERCSRDQDLEHAGSGGSST